ncbi:hypothetical protein M501DRAFT_936735, partial [Patellaria atrata CBS 101060]
MRLVNTSISGRSIWDGSSKKRFEDRIDALNETHYVPGPRVLAENDWPKDTIQKAIPFSTEKQLCDDLAFIASHEKGVEYVTAVCIEHNSSESCGLTVRLAANEGICYRVQSSVETILQLLEKCARKEISRDKCAGDIFDIIVKLNRNKLFGRLGSKFFRPPFYERRVKREELIPHFWTSIAASVPAELLDEELCAQIIKCNRSFLDLENSPGQTELRTDALKAVVKDVFSITGDGYCLPARLTELGIPPSRVEVKDVVSIAKVANYWRVCESLVHLSRSYRKLFSNLELKLIEPYGPVQSISKKHDLYVHAEVQMIVHYETTLDQPWPRAIGASKEACYLCDLFVKAHDHLYLTKSHRQIYNQWTIPDLNNYSPHTLRRFRRVISSMSETIAKDLSIARLNRIYRQHPPQSSVALHQMILPSASVTTIASS